MADIVTLAEAKAWLRVSGDDENDTIALLISAASDAVGDLADLWDGTGEVPARLKLAVLSRIAIAFDGRTDVRAALGEERLVSPLHSINI